jgi:hypothetical protein
MTGETHWFWLAMTIAVILWYSTITIYISFRGAFDIKEMLGRLDQLAKEEREAVDRRL